MQDAPDEILHLALLTFGDPAAATLAVRLQGRGTAGAVQLSSAQWSCASCWRKHGRKRREHRPGACALRGSVNRALLRRVPTPRRTLPARTRRA